jgi:hypothetical protein
MKFDHITAHKRVYSKAIELWSPFEKSAVYDRVKVCREWLETFDTQYQKINF